MNTLKIFENSEVFNEMLIAQEKYRDDLQGEEFYNKILSFEGDKFTDEFINLVYETLKSWNMNQRAAKLSDRELFKNSIITHKDVFDFLTQHKLADIHDNESIIQGLRTLFVKLELTQTKTRLVTTAKTLHFFLPELVVPMDNKYTLWFFGAEAGGGTDKEADLFIEKQITFSRFSSQIDLSQYIDNGWNKNIPKIIDNLIIAMKEY